MSHIADVCPSTKFPGGLHFAEDDAAEWLDGRCSAYGKKKIPHIKFEDFATIRF